MYFEPAKKNYYRFPSSNSINDLDSRYYFPEKIHSSGDDTRYDTKPSNSALSHDNYRN